MQEYDVALKLALRMAEYCLGVYRQLVIFLCRWCCMSANHRYLCRVNSPGATSPFATARWTSASWMASGFSPVSTLGDNVIAILAGLRDRAAAVRQVVAKIAGLRRLDTTVQAEVNKVPILNSILDHEVLGREHKNALVEMLREQIETRFGSLPQWAAEELARLTVPELRDVGVRLLKAQSLEELLR